MKLNDFVGKRKFSGIDSYSGEYGNGYIIQIDGKNYIIVEVEVDGYRSYLGEIKEVNDKIDNVFEPIDVICRIEDSEYSDILNVVDCETNEIILIIGTEDCDDYYPICVMCWYPEKMTHNVKV